MYEEGHEGSTSLILLLSEVCLNNSFKMSAWILECIGRGPKGTEEVEATHFRLCAMQTPLIVRGKTILNNGSTSNKSYHNKNIESGKKNNEDKCYVCNMARQQAIIIGKGLTVIRYILMAAQNETLPCTGHTNRWPNSSRPPQHQCGKPGIVHVRADTTRRGGMKLNHLLNDRLHKHQAENIKDRWPMPLSCS